VLKTIFGWDKKLNRYTRDFDREAEAVGTLIKLRERRKASQPGRSLGRRRPPIRRHLGQALASVARSTR